MEQLTLDLFGERRKRPEPLDEFIEWAHETHRCPPEVDAVARRLFAEMPDAFDRGKALVQVTRRRDFDGCAVEALGLFDRGIDYHVCWDRAWAYVCGMDVTLVGRVMSCDTRTYSTRPKFYDKDGNLLATLVAANTTEEALERMEAARKYGMKKKVSEITRKEDSHGKNKSEVGQRGKGILPIDEGRVSERLRPAHGVH